MAAVVADSLQLQGPPSSEARRTFTLSATPVAMTILTLRPRKSTSLGFTCTGLGSGLQPVEELSARCGQRLGRAMRAQLHMVAATPRPG